MIAILEGLFVCLFKIEKRTGSLYSEWEDNGERFFPFPSTPLK